MNEADPNEPDWQRTFYGGNYPQLLEIKDIYDPESLFVCPKCVGSERWIKRYSCFAELESVV